MLLIRVWSLGARTSLLTGLPLSLPLSSNCITLWKNVLMPRSSPANAPLCPLLAAAHRFPSWWPTRPAASVKGLPGRHLNEEPASGTRWAAAVVGRRNPAMAARTIPGEQPPSCRDVPSMRDAEDFAIKSHRVDLRSSPFCTRSEIDLRCQIESRWHQTLFDHSLLQRSCHGVHRPAHNPNV